MELSKVPAQELLDNLEKGRVGPERKKPTEPVQPTKNKIGLAKLYSPLKYNFEVQ